MKTILGVFLMATAVLATPAEAQELDIGGKIGTSAADVIKVLGDNGYELHEYERDDGYIEVEARSDIVDLEMKIDPDSGKIVKIEKEHRTAYEKKSGAGKKGRGKAGRGDDDDRDERSDRRRAEHGADDRGDDDEDDDRDDND